MNSSNFTGTDFIGVENTEFTGSGINTIDALELGDLGAITFTNTFATAGSANVDAHLRLNFGGLSGPIAIDTSGIGPVGDEIRLNISQTGQDGDEDVTIDFSGIVRGTVNSILNYTGNDANETVTGSTGDDSLNVANGQNSVTGGNGDDTLHAGTGFSTLEGGAGADSIVGNSTAGLLTGGSENDVISQGVAHSIGGVRQAVTLQGGTGNDTIIVASAQGDGSLIEGNENDDLLDFNGVTVRNSTIDGGSGTDSLELTSSNFTGTDFIGIENTLVTNNGANTIDALELPDLGTITFTDVFSNIGSTSLDGTLTLNFAGLSGAVPVGVTGIGTIGDELRIRINQTGQDGDEDITIDFSTIARGTVNSLLSYTGSSGNETLVGSIGDDSLSASTGQNSLTGGDGNDTLSTSTGFSTLEGGAGADSLDTSNTSGLFTGGSENDVIDVSVSHNFNGTRQASTLQGGTGNDTLIVSSTQGDGTVVEGNENNDFIDLNSVTLRNGVVDGGNGTNTMEVTGSNLTGTNFSNIASTLITNNAGVTLDALELSDLGTITFTDTFNSIGSATDDANLTLSFAGLTGVVPVGVTGIGTIGDELRVDIRQTAQDATQDITIDFSTVLRGTTNSLLSYTGGDGNETITGTAGDDSIDANGGQNSVTGGNGDDTLRADNGFSTLEGGAGADSLDGNSMAGLMTGGANNDVLDISTTFNDGTRQSVTLQGGTGNDTLIVAGTIGQGTLVEGNENDDLLDFNNSSFLNSTVDGGSGTDALEMSGTDFIGIENTLFTNNGTNTIDALELSDLGAITFTDTFSNIGSASDDANLTLNYSGLTGNLAVDVTGISSIGDELRVDIRQSGQDATQDITIDFSTVGRGTTNSLLSYVGNAGNETLTGSAGVDSLNASTGTNVVDGGSGNDTLQASTGLSTLRGGADNDQLSGSNTSGLFEGEAGNDVIDVNVGHFDGVRLVSTLRGGTGNDDVTLRSSHGDGTIVEGNEDNDQIALIGANVRNSTVDGGTGNDTLRIQSTQAQGTDFIGIEQTVITNNGTNVIDADQIANLGALTITDVFFNSSNRDANLALNLDGVNLADFSNLTLGENENLFVSVNNGTNSAAPFELTVDFSSMTRTGTQTLEFDNNRSFVTTRVIASVGADDLQGGSTDSDTLSYEGATSAVNVNLETGAASGTFAQGDVFIQFENLAGSDFNDTLTGTNGSNAAANNIIDGRAGNDEITTGTGLDTVLASIGNGDDTVTDFENGSDRVDLRGLPKDAAILAFLTATSAESGASTLLTFTSGGSMLLQGLAFADYDISDVILEDGVYAIDEAFTTNEDTVLNGNVILANQPFLFTDIEIDNQLNLGAANLQIQDFTVGNQTVAAGNALAFASGASLVVNADGTFTYDGTNALGVQSLSELLGQTLQQSFSYTVFSTVTNETDVGDVDITVTAVNDAPVNAGTVFGAVNEDDPALVLNLLSTWTDVDDQDVLTVVNPDLLSGGFSRNGATYTVDPSFLGFQVLNQGQVQVDIFNYDVQDAFGAITPGGVAQVTITGVNDDPTLANGTGNAVEDGPAVNIDLSVLGDDADAENDGTNLTYAVVGQPSEGSASINGTDLVFDPGADFQDLNQGQTRDVTVQVRATDIRNAQSNIADVVVTVTGVNDDPTLANGTGSAVEDGPAVNIDLSVLGDDADAENDGTNLTYSVVGQPSEGSASINGTDLVFDPGADFQDLNQDQTRDVTVQVQATDARSGVSSVADVVITVTGVNDAPTMADGVGAATEDGPATTVDLSLLGDDADAEDNGTTLTYEIVSQPGEGSATINGTDLEFDPGADFQDLNQGQTRVVTVEVQARDAQNVVSATRNVDITVTGVNDDPTLANGTGNAVEDGPAVNIDLSVLGDDADAENDGTNLTYSVVGQPSEGSASINGTDLVFDPGVDFQDLNQDQTRDVTVQVRATDLRTAHSTVADVVVTVTGVNDNPTMANGTGNAVEDGPVTTVDLALLGDDADAENSGLNLTYEVVTQPGEGSASINGTDLEFDPGADFQDLAAGQTRQVTVQVRARDAQNAVSTTEDVVITVTGVNDAPTFIGLNSQIFVPENTTAVVDLSSLDADTNDGATYSITGGADQAAFAIDSTTGELSFAAAPNFEVPTDTGLDNTYEVQVGVFDGTVTTTQTIDVTVTDVNEAAAAQVNIAVAPTSRAEGDSGTATVTFTVTRTGDISQEVQVDLGTSGTADAVDFSGVPASVTLEAGSGTATFDVTINGDTDIEADETVIVNITGLSRTDHAVAVPQATHTIQNDDVPNPSPTNDLLSTDEDTVLPLNLLGNDNSNGGGALTITQVRNSLGIMIPFGVATALPEGGLITINADGTGIFNPNGSFEGLGATESLVPSIALAYDVANAQGGTATGVNVTIGVDGVNDAPVVTSSDTFQIDENTTAVGQISSTDDDVNDGATVTITGGADQALFTIDGSGNLAFANAPDFESPGDVGQNNVYDIEVGVFDGTVTTTQSIQVTVTNVNEAPVITSTNTFIVDENTTAIVQVTATDDDGDGLAFSITGGADQALFTIDVNGNLAFVNPPDFETPGDVGQDNVYDVEVGVFDGTVTTTQAIQVMVSDVQEQLVVEGSFRSEFLAGTGADEIIRGLGGRMDVVAGGGGGDTFEFFDSIGRNLLRILDYDQSEGDVLDLNGEAVANTFTFGTTTYLILDEFDRDIIIIDGLTDPLNDLTFA